MQVVPIVLEGVRRCPCSERQFGPDGGALLLHAPAATGGPLVAYCRKVGISPSAREDPAVAQPYVGQLGIRDCEGSQDEARDTGSGNEHRSCRRRIGPHSCNRKNDRTS